MSESEDKTTELTPTDLALDLEGRHSVAETIIGKEEDQKSSLPPTLAPDDPENPKNWTPRKKIMVTFVLCVSVLTLTYSSTAYVASLPALMSRYHISQEVAILGVTLTVLGFAAGPLLWAPASEIYGRRAVYVFTGVFYGAFSWGAAVSNNAASLLIFRFLIGFFGSSMINNVPASLGDYTTPAERGVYSICYALMAFGGPSIGPLISAFIQHDAGFRWNLRVMAIFSTVLGLAVAFLPETHGPTLLKRRVAREGQAPPPLTLRMIATVFKTALARPVIYLFTEPVVMLVSIYLSVLYGILYGFFEAFTVVYLEIRGFSSTSYGLTYISLGLGSLFACVLLATIGQKLYLKSAKADAERGWATQPEARLALAYYGSILCPISLFIFAWTAPFNNVHWIAPCIAEMLFAISVMLIFTGFIPYLIDCYLQTAASALAAGMASRAIFGGVFPLFSVQMYHKLTVQGAASLLAGIACILGPIPFVFRAYGSRIRSESQYIRRDHVVA